ncbi:MAG: hypothetical protein FD157_1399 [Rhodocyclaceae bacterium]|nr:MAG: hypothetical protein FD157_1399 [Rhodocyclaceae bacterium]TND05634.1 MAG: hypothetical protein FD118_332 [Rhodocyclaceae bacterium]
MISLEAMRSYLSTSGRDQRHTMVRAEFRGAVAATGHGSCLSSTGLIARSTGAGNFGHHAIVVFPQIMEPGADYRPTRALPNPPIGLHTICSTFRQLGIQSYFCIPSVAVANDSISMTWRAKELGIPWEDAYQDFPGKLAGFQPRGRRYNFLRNHTDVSIVPDAYIPEEFSKEHLRVALSDRYISEMSDVDGIFWGRQYTYPLEIKEKTCNRDPRLGEYFGLDVGPFVKLAHYAAKRGNLHSLFIVREIADPEARELVAWRYITFDRLAQFASWVQQQGGRGMTGGNSAVVKIPKCEFEVLDANALASL